MYVCMYIMIVSFAERFKFYFCSKASIKCKSSYSSTTSQTSLKAQTEHGPLNRHKNAHNSRLNRKIKCIFYREVITFTLSPIRAFLSIMALLMWEFFPIPIGTLPFAAKNLLSASVYNKTRPKPMSIISTIV